MNCGNCKGKLEQGAAYCGNCGLKIMFAPGTAPGAPQTGQPPFYHQAAQPPQHAAEAPRTHHPGHSVSLHPTHQTPPQNVPDHHTASHHGVSHPSDPPSQALAHSQASTAPHPTHTPLPQNPGFPNSGPLPGPQPAGYVPAGYVPIPQTPPKPSGLSIASLVLGLVGFLMSGAIFGGFLGLGGIITGILGLHHRQDKARCIIGIVLGVLAVLVAGFVAFMLFRDPTNPG